jgi:hypothetical protein
MTQRLLETQDLRDPDEAETARLLRSLAPAAASEAMEKRVYARICARPAHGQRWLRTAVLAAGLLVSTAILGATLARDWWTRPDRGRADTPALILPVDPSGPTAQREQEPSVKPTPTEITPTPPTEKLVAPGSAPRVSSHRDHPSARLAEKRQPIAASDVSGTIEQAPAEEVAPAPPPPEEAALVMAALRSLRREHNPVQAGTLSQRYLTRFPQGVLNQEALAIGIEAAVARHDAASATALANQYLGRFPAGRFAGLARKTVSARP